MKTYCLFITMMLTWNCALAEIKNGYAWEVKGIRESLKSLHTILTTDNDLSVFQRIEIKNKIYKLLEYITYFELTEELLTQFRQIAPDIYYEIDTLKSNTGKAVTVYVKFAPEEEMRYGAHGTTNLGHCENDVNVYSSEYGAATVSIKIASVNRSLSLLAHEFGHVRYQVPHLATYTEDYSTWYQNETFKSSYIGHNSKDPSGLKAIEYENIFRDRYLNFIKTASKMESPMALLGIIRKSVDLNQF